MTATAELRTYGKHKWQLEKQGLFRKRSDSKSSVTSGLFSSQSPSDLQSFFSVCFSVYLHADIVFLFSGVTTEQYRSPFEESVVQFIILLMVWQ